MTVPADCGEQISKDCQTVSIQFGSPFAFRKSAKERSIGNLQETEER